jgi:hypothetical protein
MKNYIKIGIFIIIAIPVYVSSVFSMLIYIQSGLRSKGPQTVYVSEGSENNLLADMNNYFQELPQTGESDNSEFVTAAPTINRYCSVKTIKNEEPVEVNPDKVFSCSAFLDDGVYNYSADVLDMAAEVDDKVMTGQCINATKEISQNDDGSYDVVYTDCLMN